MGLWTMLVGLWKCQQWILYNCQIISHLLKIWQKLFTEAHAFYREEFGFCRDELIEEVLLENEKQNKIVHKVQPENLTGA